MAPDRSLTRHARVVRASIVSVAAVLIAAMSHIAAGGNTPSVYALVAGSVVVLPVVLVLTSATFGIVRTFTSVAITQALFHWMFASLGVTNPVADRGEPLPAHAEHFGMVEEFVPILPGGSGADVAMWLSHLVAAAVTVWILRRGERAVETMMIALRRCFFHRLTSARALPVVPTPPRVDRSHDDLPSQLELWTSISHRGPPALTDAL